MIQPLKVAPISDKQHHHRIFYVSANNKKKVFEILAQQLAKAIDTIDGITVDDIFIKLLERERLGSTVVGNGLAIPHARFLGLPEAKGALLILDNPVDFQDGKKEPVKVIFGLLVPEAQCDAHIECLREIASLAQNDTTMHILSHTNNTEVLGEWLQKTHPQLARLLQ